MRACWMWWPQQMLGEISLLWRSTSYQFNLQSHWKTEATSIFVRLLFQANASSHRESSFRIDLIRCQGTVHAETIALRPWLVIVLLWATEQAVLWFCICLNIYISTENTYPQSSIWNSRTNVEVVGGRGIETLMHTNAPCLLWVVLSNQCAQCPISARSLNSNPHWLWDESQETSLHKPQFLLHLLAIYLECLTWLLAHGRLKKSGFSREMESVGVCVCVYVCRERDNERKGKDFTE